MNSSRKRERKREREDEIKTEPPSSSRTSIHCIEDFPEQQENENENRTKFFCFECIFFWFPRTKEKYLILAEYQIFNIVHNSPGKKDEVKETRKNEVYLRSHLMMMMMMSTIFVHLYTYVVCVHVVRMAEKFIFVMLCACARARILLLII